MKIDKVSGSFNTYKMEVSFAEVVAIETALAANHDGVVADELYAGIEWFLKRLPRPGEDEEKVKAEQKGEKDSKKAGSSTDLDSTDLEEPPIDLDHEEETAETKDVDNTELPEPPTSI